MIVGGLAAAGRFLPRAWRETWAALLLASAAIAVALNRGELAPWIAAFAMALIARGGLWRLASQTGRPGPGGLQFGIVELRLAATWGLAALFLAIVCLLAFVLLLAGAYAAASAGPGFNPMQIATWAPAITGRGRLLLGGVAALCGLGVVIAAVRVSLAEAATIERGRIQLLSSFVLTRGRTLFLASSYLILAVPALALATWGRGSRDIVVAAAEGGAIGGLWLPMSVGLMAYAYRSGDGIS